MINLAKRVTIIATISILLSCHDRHKQPSNITEIKDDIEASEKKYKMNNDTVKLQMELQSNIETDGEGSVPTYRYSEMDVNIALPIISQGLLDKGFKVLDDAIFQVRILNIFGDIFHPSNPRIKFHEHFTTILENDSVDQGDEYDYTIDNIFISKDYRYITWVPLLGDFIIFTDSAQYKIDLHPKIISRNKYLFNNSRPDLAYLLHEDTLFLKTLVTSFGYTKEPKINDLVMNDYLDMDDKHMATVGEIIFVKNGKGELVIKEELLKWIADHTSANDIRMLMALDTYGSLLFDSNQSTISKTNPFSLFTPNEKRKIVAYIGSIYEPLFNKFSAGKATMWPVGSAFDNLLSTDDGFEAYLKQHHYFSLPALKNILEPSE
ncbi:hypothetical protein ACTJJ0_07875 [Chitinophaga sp. 22321]|uniref:Lipoprotein n=1 Tax=Chitinophaga hostae TaxID=2831022 RepID=A0ABS5ITI7_9BACT|nr:hypothetical protein [Chitinophaga hostae]MBS0026276.1 hypothetical protein [Chitinophaga hostae]